MVLDAPDQSEITHQKWLVKWFQVLHQKGLTAKGVRFLAITRRRTSSTDPEKLDFVEKLTPISTDVFNLADIQKPQKQAKTASAVQAGFDTVVAGLPVDVGPKAGANKKIEDAILTLPGTLGDTIDEILNNIKDSSALDLRTLLSVMIAAAEPLTAVEMHLALRVSRGKTSRDRFKADEDKMSDWMRKVARPILVIDKNRVRFVHLSVREYLVRDVGTDVGRETSGRTWKGFTTEAAAHKLFRDLCASHLKDQTIGWIKDKRARKDDWNDPLHLPVWEFLSTPDPSDIFLTYALENSLYLQNKSDPEKLPTSHTTSRAFSFPFDKPMAIVKTGKADSLLPSARNQHFARIHLQRLPQQEREDISIPEIYHVVHKHPYAYVFTAYVEGRRITDNSKAVGKSAISQMLDQIARAIKVFLSFPIPADMPVGPVGGGDLVAGPFGHDLP